MHFSAGPQNDNDGKIDQCHKAHQDVCGAPYKSEFHDRACQYNQRRNDAEGVKQCFAGCSSAEIFSAPFLRNKVADQCGKGKQAQGNGNEYGAELPQGIRSRCLNPGHTFKLSAGCDTGAKQHK